MLYAYIPNEYDVELDAIAPEYNKIQETLASEAIEILLAVAEMGADVSLEDKLFLERKMQALSENFVLLSELKVRVIDICARAEAAGKSISGMPPDEVSSVASNGLSIIGEVRGLLSNDIDLVGQELNRVKITEDFSKVASILGDGVGPLMEVIDIYNLIDDDVYEAAGVTVSAYLGVLLLCVEKGFLASAGWSVSAGYAVSSFIITNTAADLVESVLDHLDLLELYEIAPQPGTLVGSQLASVLSLMQALSPDITYNEAIRVLGASSGEYGDRLDSFVNFVKEYFDGGELFPNALALAPSIRQFSFEQGKEQFDLIVLPDLSYSEIENLAKFDSGAGRSIRYAMENLVPFATHEVVGTKAMGEVYDKSNYSDNYISDRAVFLAGYLEGLRLNNDSILEVDGGLDVFVEYVKSDIAWLGYDAEKHIRVSNRVFAPDYDLSMYFGKDGQDNEDWSGGSGQVNFYGKGGDDTFMSGGGLTIWMGVLVMMSYMEAGAVIR